MSALELCKCALKLAETKTMCSKSALVQCGHVTPKHYLQVMLKCHILNLLHFLHWNSSEYSRTSAVQVQLSSRIRSMRHFFSVASRVRNIVLVHTQYAPVQHPEYANIFSLTVRHSAVSGNAWCNSGWNLRPSFVSNLIFDKKIAPVGVLFFY